MAANISKADPSIPTSTGAVEFDPVQTEHTQPVEAASTGAVAYQAPGESTVEHHGSDNPVVDFPTPGPVTMTVSWLGDEGSPDDVEDTQRAEGATDKSVEGADTKVITPEDKPGVKPAKTTAATKKDGGSR